MNSLGLLTTDTPDTLPPWAVAVGGWVDYAHNPLQYRYLDGSYTPLISDQFFLEPVFNIGLLPVLDMALAVPVLLRQNGSNTSNLGDLSGTGIGDIRLSARLNPLPARIFGAGLSIVGEFGFPTGTGSLKAGGGTVSFTPKVLASLPLPRDITALAALEAAIKGTENLGGVPLQSTFTLRGGVKVPFFIEDRAYAGTAELVATTPFAAPFSKDGVTVWEGFLGGTTTFERGASGAIDVAVGASAGFSQGVGVPAVRGILALTWRSFVGDRDHDGVPDTADTCPDDPEDLNGYADLDGCPDALEMARVAKEASAATAVPPPTGRARVCPDGPCDRDHDGIADTQDMCPYVPEDKDGVQDDDGCPDFDNDHDGVPDDRDQCPNRPETINGIDDEDGCPDAGEGATTFVPRVGVTIKTTIQFETGRAVIKGESYPVLDQVALQLLAHAEVLRVRIEGHTDSAGPASKNLTLSQARANAVRQYLVDHGVGRGRLVAEGFGETRPVASNDTADGRAQNRRVTFVILQTR